MIISRLHDKDIVKIKIHYSIHKVFWDFENMFISLPISMISLKYLVRSTSAKESHVDTINRLLAIFLCPYLPHTSLHLESYESIQFCGIFERELFDNRRDKSVDNHSFCLILGNASTLQVVELLWADTTSTRLVSTDRGRIADTDIRNCVIF
jgi:hypothetical protein